MPRSGFFSREAGEAQVLAVFQLRKIADLTYVISKMLVDVRDRHEA